MTTRASTEHTPHNTSARLTSVNEVEAYLAIPYRSPGAYVGPHRQCLSARSAGAVPKNSTGGPPIGTRGEVWRIKEKPPIEQIGHGDGRRRDIFAFPICNGARPDTRARTACVSNIEQFFPGSQRNISRG